MMEPGFEQKLSDAKTQGEQLCHPALLPYGYCAQLAFNIPVSKMGRD